MKSPAITVLSQFLLIIVNKSRALENLPAVTHGLEHAQESTSLAGSETTVAQSASQAHGEAEQVISGEAPRTAGNVGRVDMPAGVEESGYPLIRSPAFWNVPLARTTSPNWGQHVSDQPEVPIVNLPLERPRRGPDETPHEKNSPHSESDMKGSGHIGQENVRDPELTTEGSEQGGAKREEREVVPDEAAERDNIRQLIHVAQSSAQGATGRNKRVVLFLQNAAAGRDKLRDLELAAKRSEHGSAESEEREVVPDHAAEQDHLRTLKLPSTESEQGGAGPNKRITFFIGDPADGQDQLRDPELAAKESEHGGAEREGSQVIPSAIPAVPTSGHGDHQGNVPNLRAIGRAPHEKDTPGSGSGS